MLAKAEAIRLLKKHVKSVEIRKHSIAVSELMGEVARRFRISPEEWQLCGLLHDLDRERIQGDMSKHGLVAAELLESLLSRDSLHAIRAHDHRTGVTPRSIMDKALIASDAVTTFFSELVEREQIGQLAELNSKTFPKIFEDKPFRKLGYLKNRIEICREIGIPLDEFLSHAREAFDKKNL
nr:HDIG domain-containing protein [Candidatus Njordarchaeum guaymaensis]